MNAKFLSYLVTSQIYRIMHLNVIYEINYVAFLIKIISSLK